MNEWLSQPQTDFRTIPLPEPGVPAGYAALIDRHELRARSPGD
ncbi:MAG: hypothetical protein JWQ16_1340 [Novosphingobium sp.]|nr:hypothetical protein [Novosphingobium sp.]